MKKHVVASKILTGALAVAMVASVPAMSGINAKADDKVTISLYTTVPGHDDDFEKFCADFMEANPDITVNYIAYDSSEKQKWMTLYASGDAPTISIMDPVDIQENIENMAAGGYNFSHQIDSKVLQGLFRTSADLANANSRDRISVKTIVNTHSHGIYLLHSIDELKKVVGVPSQKVKNILQRLFRKGKRTQYKLVSLENNDFYAFIINNVKKLKEEFREIVADDSVQLTFLENAKTTTFKIPEMEVYKFASVKKVVLFNKNAYKEYTNEFVTSKTRSTSERLFENYCENNSNVEWFYKNGDAGQQYLSIVYQDGLRHQWLFYPDYIVKMKNGDIWIIETKGGMQNGYSKNIDIQVKNKFDAFKAYANKYNLNWGFVRDIDEQLYINNSIYSDDMSGDNWISLEDVL